MERKRCPGSKIRSKGLGRGLGLGRRQGPIGIPVKKKEAVAMKKSTTITMRKKGKKPIRFQRGALHRALGVPQGKTIPPGKKAAALAGKYGPAVKKKAVFGFRGALAAGRATRRKKLKKGIRYHTRMARA